MNPYYSVAWTHQEVNERVHQGMLTREQAEDWFADPDLTPLQGYIL